MSNAGSILSLVGGIISLLVTIFFRWTMYRWILSGVNMMEIAAGMVTLLIYIFSFVSIVGGILGIKENKTGTTLCIISGVMFILLIIFDITIWMLILDVLETNDVRDRSPYIMFAIIRAIVGIPSSILVLVGGIVGKKALQIDEKDSSYIVK